MLQYLRNKFTTPTGYLPDPFDPRDVYEDEVGSDEGITIPEAYEIRDHEYEYQGAYPFCASFAATTLAEWKYKHATNGEVYKFSPPHLFFHAGGSENGSYFRTNLDVLLKNGAISYNQFPMPSLRFGPDSGWHAKMKAEALAVPFTDAKKIGGYVRVSPAADRIKRSILQYGPLLIGVSTYGTWYSSKYAVRAREYDNHAVLLVGWDKDGNWLVFDSLKYVANDDGFRWLHNSYAFYSIYAITELPENWREVRDKKRSEGFDHVLNHYGKPRSFETEVRVAAELLEKFKQFKNQSVLEAAGKFWTVFINGASYGEYTYTDIVNSTYHWRRTGKHIFNFNVPKSDPNSKLIT